MSKAIAIKSKIMRLDSIRKCFYLLRNNLLFDASNGRDVKSSFVVLQWIEETTQLSTLLLQNIIGSFTEFSASNLKEI